jgi:NAD(P)-dependent dehydrogenase (short-subunit alcohol dehydrogenase family)/acyl carrier protein
MGVGVEDVVAIKALETGIVPPVPNFKEEDPELGPLNLSRGGLYQPRYALRLAAGFGSQISMSLLRWLAPPDGRRRAPDDLGYRHRIADRTLWSGWLARMGGHPDPELEVVQRTLRIREPLPAGAPVKPVQAPAPVAVAVALQAAAPAQAPVTVKVDASPPCAVDDPVAARVLAMVAEKTGYPAEMLGLDLDLEADLGVDTVKQAELFAMLREAYSIQRDDQVKLRDYPTLAHVIRFIHERSAANGMPAPKPAPAAAPAPAATVNPIALAAANAFQRRVPVPVLRPPLDFFKPTGVTLENGIRVAVVAGGGAAGRSLAARLRGRGAEVLVVDDFPSEDELARRMREWASQGKVGGVYWLPALDVEPALADLDLVAWKEGLRRRVKLLHATVRGLGEAIGPTGTFLIAATALGGSHGYGAGPATGPMGGAVTGFTKAFSRERPSALVKAVDFEPDADPEAVSDQLIAETLRDPGVVEVGREAGLRWAIGLEQREATGNGLTLNGDSVFLVTGAAGGIVSAIVADLAAASAGTFHLLDLTPEPDPADADLARFGSDRAGLKNDIAQRLRDTGERPTPALVEKRLAAIERSHAALSAINAVRGAGGVAVYHAVDITNSGEVARVVAGIGGRHGRIDVLIHAAGLEISHSVPDKDAAEFARVFDVKSDGWFNLLHAAGQMPIGALLAFSSVAARFGNAGQTDYSAANDLLCKSVSSLRWTRPATRAIAIDWTAWAGIGMATRGSIPRVMELAGIEMLEPECGIATVRRELMSDTTSGEVVVAGRLGALLAQSDADGGLDPTASTPHPMVGTLVGIGENGDVRAETTIDPKCQPYLDHHRIDGVPVLPGVMGIEALCELASLSVPGHEVVAVEAVEFAAPFKFYRDAPRTLLLDARFRKQGDELVAACRMVGSRELQGLAEPQVTTHSSALVRLARRRPGSTEAAPVTTPSPSTAAVDAADIYRVYFHGPAFKVLEKVWTDGKRVIGLMAADLPAGHSPAELPLLTDPRLIELCFQTAGAWELGTSGRLALPSRIGELSWLEVPEMSPGTRLFAVVTPLPGGGFDAEAIDSTGRVHARLRGYTTIALPAAIDEAHLAPFRAAFGGGR